MWRLHRYYLKELAISAAITFLVMFGVVFVSLIARGIQRSEGGQPLDVVKTMLLWAVDAIPHLLTISFQLAVVLTYTRAAQDRELTAIRAAGISPRTAMVPAVLLGVLLSGLASYANHYVIPDVYYQKFRVVADVVRNTFRNLKLGSDRIQIPNTDFVLTFRRRSGDALEDCTIYCPPSLRLQKTSSPILRVSRVRIPVPTTGSEQIQVQLEGARDPITGEFFPQVEFDLDPRDIADRDRREERDDDLRSDQLLAEVARGVHPRVFEALYTLFRRCNYSLMPALLAPIGFCIAEMARERGRVLALLFGLVPLVIFYFGEVVGARMLRATDNPWTAWTPVALLLVFGLPLCWRQLRR